MTIVKLHDGACLWARNVVPGRAFVVGEIPVYEHETIGSGATAVAVPRLVGWQARRWRTRDVVEIIGPRTVIA